jgi:hypothetical protein
MQQVQKIHSFPGRQETVPPLRVTTVQPSLVGRIKLWVIRAFPRETITEILLGVFTLYLLAVLFIGVARGMAHYTIVPMP